MERMHIMDKSKQAYRLGLYEKAMPNHLSILEKLEWTKQSGFDYLELSIDESDEKLARLQWNQAQRLQVREWMQVSGVRIDSICLSGHRKYPLGSLHAEVRERANQIMCQAIDLAYDLGIRMIQLAGYDVYYEESSEQTVQYFSENLHAAVLYASYKGILLGFETMETPFMDTVSKAMHYVKQEQSCYLNVYPDIGNLKNASLVYQTSLLDDLRCGVGHIIASHLKETRPGIYREVTFGSGHTPYIDCLTQLKAMGVRMFVGEFWDVGKVTWQQDLVAANQFLRTKLDHVFGGENDE